MVGMKDHNARFWAYSNYLIALARLIEREHNSTNELANFIAKSSGFRKIYLGSSVDFEGIAQSLRLSWYTELLLSKILPYEDILPYTTPWSMVQTYYAIYPAVRAYFMALGRRVDKSHETSIKTIGADFVSCKERFPHPWCSVLAEDPAKQTFTLINDPNNTVISMSNPLNSPYTNNPWNHYGLFLRTTRERILIKKTDYWKRENNRKRITVKERGQLLQQLRPTNVLDALYRVRARSNYQDIDSFAFTSVQGFDYIKLQNAMNLIVDNTLLVFEIIIAKALGKNRFKQIVNEFSITPLGNDNGKTYQRRWNVIQSVL